MLDILKLMDNKVYLNGGRGPVEFDCFGFCAEVYRQFGIELPAGYGAPVERHDRDVAIRGEMENTGLYEALSVPEVPCLVAFMIRPPYVTHVGVVIGNNEFIHMIEGAGVSVNNLSHHIWKKRIAGFYRYAGDANV